MGPGTHLLTAPMLGIDITPGVHPQVKMGGLTFDVDIIWATLIAAGIVITMGLVLRRKATSGVPGKFQLLWELAVGAVQKQVDDTIGPRGAQVVPLALTLFVFIFTCNLFEVLSIGSTYDWLPAPTSDVNLPAGHGPLRDRPGPPGRRQEPRGPRLLQALLHPPVPPRSSSSSTCS